ncbi:MAG: hypothetical protein KO463_01370 [Candidatus Methanofastidiosa archaeon]|nr:hypothetical protein [Candidatus Methanofastidiosa archaeon]
MQKRSLAKKVTLIYAILSVSYIILSDVYLGTIIEDASNYTTIQMVKGLLFVTVSAVVIYHFVSQREQELLMHQRRLENRTAQLYHDIQTPLSTIGGYTTSLEQLFEPGAPSPDWDDVYIHLAAIRKAADKVRSDAELLGQELREGTEKNGQA